MQDAITAQKILDAAQRSIDENTHITL